MTKAARSYPPPVSLRLSEDERISLEKAAQGMTLSAYIRSRLFGESVSPRRTRGKPDGLPSVDEAKVRQASDMRAAFQRHVAEAREQKRGTLEPLEERRKSMVRQHREERARLDHKQEQRWMEENQARAARLQSGLRGIWQRLSGGYARIRKRNEQEAYAALIRDREQRNTLIITHLKERRELQRQIKAVRKQYAIQFGEIRQDRKRYQHIEQSQVESLQRTYGLSSSNPHAAERIAPQQSGKSPQPDSEERLYRLHRKHKGPDRER